MINRDFFKNGSLTSRSQVPELMAAIWMAGRETMLVEDKVDRTTKDALCAVLSQINDCPYCEDMLVSLVHAGGEHGVASDIITKKERDISDPEFRAAIEWLQAITNPESTPVWQPFGPEQLPEVIGTLMAMSDINRFSHIVMEDSPVSSLFGDHAGKAMQLRLFGTELTSTRRVPLKPGDSLSLLPAASLPYDMSWAAPNPRVADAIGRYAATVERMAEPVISPEVSSRVAESLQAWNGETMPISRAWVEPEVAGLADRDAAIARLSIVLAKSPYQVDVKLAETVLKYEPDEDRFIRILAWASFSGARRFARLIARRAEIWSHVPAPSGTGEIAVAQMQAIT